MNPVKITIDWITLSEYRKLAAKEKKLKQKKY